MKSSIIFLILALTCSQVIAQRNGAIIFVPSDIDPKVLEAVNDMSYWLERMSGTKYTIREPDHAKKDGIHLLWLQQANISEKEKIQLEKDGQSFYLKATSSSSAYIIGTGKSSFINGIYTYLQELGFRWYMPGDAWTIIPSSPGRAINISKAYSPDFRNRLYAGAGGLRPIPGVDPQNTFQKDFNLWNLRNRFSSDYFSKGHTGHLFYTAQKKELDKNPSWFCKGEIDPYGRIDISKPKVVDLFVEWALGQVKPADLYPVIGVDPSDGSGGNGDCLPSGMPGIKSWSDKYFWLANRVAEKIPASDNKTVVQLYAYGNHAPLPGFSLNKRIYPVIIPYAFQRVTTPVDFIKQWHQKLEGRPMGIYDYWNITQWSVGLPQFNIYSIPEKLRLWKQYNITTIHLESTNAKGPMGHSFWLGSHMMWNTGLSFDSLYTEFLNECFGPAAADVKKMYDRWSLNYQERMEVNLSLQDLAAAANKTKDQAILTRLTELKAYIHYLKLYYDYRANSTIPAYNKLISYMHQIHPLRLLQTWPLQKYYIKPPKGYTPPVSKGNKEAPPVNFERLYAAIEQNFKQDSKDDKITYQITDFAFDISKAKPSGNNIKNSVSFVTGPNRYEFYVPVKKNLAINVGSTVKSKVTILDSDGNIVKEKEIPAGKTGYSEISASLTPGKYFLLIGAFGGFSRIVFPGDILFVSSSDIIYFDNAHYPLLYLYVPEATTEIIYEDLNGPGTNKRGFWRNPDGKRVNPEKIKSGIYRVAVPSQYRGKVWILDIGHRSFSVLNIPSRFSLTGFTYKEN